MSTTIVIRVDDPDLTEKDVHETVIIALDLAGFREWTSYVAAEGTPLPEPRIDPPGWPW